MCVEFPVASMPMALCMLGVSHGAECGAICPQVRYIVETMPVMLESGTKTLSLPSELYGCPYPPNPALPPGTCAAPDLCNCNAGICFGTCKGERSSASSHLI